MVLDPIWNVNSPSHGDGGELRNAEQGQDTCEGPSMSPTSSSNTESGSGAYQSRHTSSNHHRARDDIVPPCITRSYHPKINGKLLQFFKCIIFVYYLVLYCGLGKICNEQGDEIPEDAQPTPRSSDPSHGSDDWTPYNNRVEFELADFLYRHNQMSGGDINFILNLWAASLAVHGDAPPFSSHTEMYNTIDSTPLGDVPWQTFSLQYNGDQPEDEVPSWMTAEYDVWFRDPRTLVHNLISNPDFKDEFDYAPLQEYDTNGAHRFQNFMSGDWCWKQAVCSSLKYYSLSHFFLW
jgi:hypothetical protein